MRTITVNDPYFGAWLGANLNGYWASIGYYATGPLATREIRIGQIRNYGTVVEGRDGTREKNCTHYWVEGSISGVVTPPASPRILPFSDSGFEVHKSSKYNTKDWTVQQSVSISGEHVNITVSGTFVEWFRPNQSSAWRKIHDRQGSMTYRLDVHVDEVSGSVVYDNLTLVGRTGDCTNGFVHNRTCPYGASGDYIGPEIHLVEYWIQATMALSAGKVELDRTARRNAVLDAFDNTELAEVNWLELAKDAGEPLAVLERLSGIFRGNSKARTAVKACANLHLMWKYMIKTNLLTYSELRKLLRALRRGFRHQRLLDKDIVGHGSVRKELSGEGYSGSDTYTAKVVLAPGFGPFGSVQQLQSLGLLPKASDVWDLIPYSFVVDWLIPVQDTIAQLEGVSATMHLPFRYAVIGRKKELHYSKTWVTASGHTFQIVLTHVEYERWVKFTLPNDLSVSHPFRDPRKHALTGAALVVQSTLR